jgi:uncharacterized protein
MEQKPLIGDGHDRRLKYRGRLSAKEVLQRYKDLPAFVEIDLIDVNQVGRFEERPLDVAAVRGNLEELYALLDAGADVNGIGELGNTALHEAVGQEQFDVVKVLLEFGARTDIHNEFGDTPLDIAVRHGRQDIIDLLK